MTAVKVTSEPVPAVVGMQMSGMPALGYSSVPIAVV